MEIDKKIIEEELFIKEEERQINVRELSKCINTFLKIDPISKQIVPSDKFKQLSNYKGIAVFLTAIYLGQKAEVFEKDSLTLPELSERLREKQTTLSSPMNQLVKDNFIIPKGGSGSREYKVNELSIKLLLDKLNSD